MATRRSERRRQRQHLCLFWTMVMQAIVIYNDIRRREQHLPRAPHINWDSEREMTLTRMFGTSDTICRDLLRMKIGSFQRLCARLQTYGLDDSRYVRIEEQVAIFLNTVGHDQRNRVGRFTFFRSGQTVSFYFHRVLHACLRLYADVVINATPHNSPYEKKNVQPWYSFFQDAVGAIDGTHIAANVPLEDQARYRNRKQVISQNVLVACTFDMKFTYVLAGWEGSAHDGRLLRSAIIRQGHKLTIPIGKYYLVDAGFPLVSGFLAPYRRTRYHRRDIVGQRPESNFMAHNQQRSTAPFRVPRPNLHSDVEDMSSNQVDPNSRLRQIRWSDTMDGYMIAALLHQVLSSHKRSDNGFSSYHVSKAIESVFIGCGVVVSDKNVRARLKTLKKEYVEVGQLLSMSGFGLDPDTGRVTTDILAWEEFLKGKPEFGKWRTKLCPRYDDLEAIFGNDSATGDRAVTDNDNLSPIHDENVNEVDGQNEDTNPCPIRAPKRNAEGGTNKTRRRRTQPNDESLIALSSIAESSKEIANAMKIQATLDTLNHINWQLVLEKLQGMNVDKRDIMQLMKVFRSDESLARVFMSLTDEEFMRDFVFENLGRDPPPIL